MTITKKRKAIANALLAVGQHAHDCQQRDPNYKIDLDQAAELIELLSDKGLLKEDSE